jgi:hypothetical protein
MLCALICIPALHAFSHAMAQGQRPGEFLAAETRTAVLLEHTDPAICPHHPPIVRPAEPVAELPIDHRPLIFPTDTSPEQGIGLYTLLSVYRI